MKIIITTILFVLFITSLGVFVNNLSEIYSQPTDGNITKIETTLLFSSDNGNVTNVKVIDTNDPMKIEISFIEKGKLYLKEPIEVTNQGTYIDTYLTNNIVRGEGKGIMTTDNGEIIAWNAYDSKLMTPDGNLSQIYKGIIFFKSNSENLNFIDEKIGLYISKIGSNGESGDRQIYEWN